MMKKRISFLLQVLIVCTLSAQNIPPLATENVLQGDIWSGWQMPENTSNFSDLNSALDFIFDSVAGKSPLKGYVATIIFKDSSIWQRAIGKNSELPNDKLTNNMALGFGSATKMLTATVVHQLVTEGKLSLDDQLHDWLPKYANIDSSITIRQLLNHTSGLSNYTENPFFLLSVISNFSRIWTAEELLPFQTAPISTPGKRFYYSNANYLLLSMIIEAATGNSYSSELRQRILTPLGMTHTFSFPVEPPSVPIGHIWYDLNGDGVADDFEAAGYSINAIFSSMRGSASVLGSSGDLTVFIRGLATGQLLHPVAQTKLMTFDSLSSNQPNGASYGLGISRRLMNDRTMIGHNGYIFHQTRAYHFPQEAFSLVVQTNEGNEDTSVTNIDDVFGALAFTCFKYLSATEEPGLTQTLPSIFPNPVHDFFTIQFKDENPRPQARLRLLNTQGKVLFEKMGISNVETVLTAGFDAGVYFWEILDSGSMMMGKVIVIR